MLRVERVERVERVQKVEKPRGWRMICCWARWRSDGNTIASSSTTALRKTARRTHAVSGIPRVGLPGTAAGAPPGVETHKSPALWQHSNILVLRVKH